MQDMGRSLLRQPSRIRTREGEMQFDIIPYASLVEIGFFPMDGLCRHSLLGCQEVQESNTKRSSCLQGSIPGVEEVLQVRPALNVQSIWIPVVT